jgi:hypothetical protein
MNTNFKKIPNETPDLEIISNESPGPYIPNDHILGERIPYQPIECRKRKVEIGKPYNNADQYPNDDSPKVNYQYLLHMELYGNKPVPPEQLDLWN